MTCSSASVEKLTYGSSAFVCDQVGVYGEVVSEHAVSDDDGSLC